MNALPKTSSPSPLFASTFAVAVTLAVVWVWTGACLAGRLTLAYSYTSVATLPPWLEPFAAPTSCTLLLVVAGAMAPLFLFANGGGLSTESLKRVRGALIYQALACLPLLYTFAIGLVAPETSSSIWEVILFAGASGLFAREFSKRLVESEVAQGIKASGASSSSILVILIVIFTISWTIQANEYYRSFRLGFNDAGHFTQRIANTANGQGFLLESPVLPPFWDHFNPGLLFFVPVWSLISDARIMFALQSLAIGWSAWLILKIGKAYGLSDANSTLWGMGWLLFPVVGQINLAYTYGWHPIVFGVPFLLLAHLSVLRNRYAKGILYAIVASSFEEGVIVVIGCYGAAKALEAWFSSRVPVVSPGVENTVPGETPGPRAIRSLLGWGAVWLVATVSFVLVYKWSGLAEFQTARFARLGTSTWEVALSPFLKPSEFFSLLLRPRNLIFLAIWFLPGLVAKGWRVPWSWIAISLPMLVLVVWEHEPAQSITFQYTVTLIPLLLLGCMESQRAEIQKGGSAKDARGFSPSPLSTSSVGFITTAGVLSLFLGQFPWGVDSLLDVKLRTYSMEDEVNQRLPGGVDHAWITEKLRALPPVKETRILATGRIAMHLVGAKDLETVGQFGERRQSLGKLHGDLASPLLAYEILILDMREEFQQTAEQSRRVAEEALSLGFERTEQKYGFEFYRSPKQLP